MELGASIGADVPYCVIGGTALAEGIGEKLTPLEPAPECFVLVAKPDINVSTRYVYERLNVAAIEKHPDIDGMVAAIGKGSLQGILDRMENVLESVTVQEYPVVDALKHRLPDIPVRLHFPTHFPYGPESPEGSPCRLPPPCRQYPGAFRLPPRSGAHIHTSWTH